MIFEGIVHPLFSETPSTVLAAVAVVPALFVLAVYNGYVCFREWRAKRAALKLPVSASNVVLRRTV